MWTSKLVELRALTLVGGPAVQMPLLQSSCVLQAEPSFSKPSSVSAHELVLATLPTFVALLNLVHAWVQFDRSMTSEASLHSCVPPLSSKSPTRQAGVAVQRDLHASSVFTVPPCVMSARGTKSHILGLLAFPGACTHTSLIESLAESPEGS